MKRGLVFGAILGAVLLGSSTLSSTPGFADPGRARWGFGVDFGFGGVELRGGYHRGPRYRHHRHVVHHHVRVPVYSRVWVPPVHETVFVGYDSCGFPIRERVIVRHGYYRTVVNGYRCDSCGAACH